MTITEAQRSALYQSMKTLHGADVTETIMLAYPTLDDDKLATKRDVGQLGAELRGEMAELRTEMAELRGDLRAEMAELRGDLRAEMAELRGDLRAEMAELRGDLRSEVATIKSELAHTFGTWLFASQAGVVAAVALVLALMR